MSVVPDVEVVVVVDVVVDAILSRDEDQERSTMATRTSTFTHLRPLATRNGWAPSIQGFKRLDVYQCSIPFYNLATRLAECAPESQRSLFNQLRHAAISVPLSIADASCSPRDSARFYATARRSALECKAILDAIETLCPDEQNLILTFRELLARVVSMLTDLERPMTSQVITKGAFTDTEAAVGEDFSSGNPDDFDHD